MFFHSASFNTKGILVNVRDGGLKKDLSLGLTRKDFGNEDEELLDKDNNNAPEYFERPTAWRASTSKRRHTRS